MYKDKSKQTEADRERQRRYREKTKGVTKQGVTSEKEGENVTPKSYFKDGIEMVPPAYMEHPAIILALADPVKRDKLQRITAQLKAHKVLDSVRYGISGPTFTEVGKMLAVLE